MTIPADLRCDARTGRCHVCGDEAVIGRVVNVDARTRMGTVAFPERSETVALDLVDARVGDEVLVHLGFAIERMELT
ncbi:MAG TPA: HypC/HybG/HupF family hydrogenase formation chaperone [Gemmatimonadaceae bacterium]|nr:HypC/HybG/HupF family hydrogenase formation chaperone [Gemmatimonadaceae bacterium]